MSRQPSFRGVPDIARLITAAVALFFALAVSGGLAHGQKPPDPAPAQQSPPAQSSPTPAPPTAPAAQATDSDKNKASAAPSQASEVVTRDTGTTFKVRVNLVLVRVVVRDEHGKIVDNLKKEDFQLFDNRKPQAISTFAAETPATHAVPVVDVSSDGEPAEKALPGPALPQRFVAMMFDDLHLKMQDAVTVRAAGVKILDALTPTDRVGVYSTSGQVTQEFTADRELLKQAMNRIIARPVNGENMAECPDLSYYQADLIVNKSDAQALSVAAADTLECAFGGDPRMISAATSMANSAAQRVLNLGDVSTEYAYSHIDALLRRLGGMPGQRKMVFISPGFLLTTLIAERSDVIDRATKAGIVIDSVDARGLYTSDVGGDIANPPAGSSSTVGFKSSYRVQSQFQEGQILADFAYGTGGTYFHDRNDLDVGLRNSIAAPSVTYLLGFSPQNLKLNGSFHLLKVSLTSKQKYTLQARRGYYAPRTLKDPEETAKEEIQEAVFSQEEIRDLPLDLQTQFFRSDATKARLSVLARLDLRSLKFKRVGDRNADNLTLATVIFDENGNYVTGGEKILEMNLLDATLQKLDRSGITVKSSFDVKPGNYLVRLVIRDKEGELMAARNGAVAIPY